MYSKQPNLEQLNTAIDNLSGTNRRISAEANRLLLSIDGTNSDLLPRLVEAIGSSLNSDVITSSALAISRYGDRAQSHVGALAKLLTPACNLNPFEADAIIFALSKIQCAGSVEVFRQILKDENPLLISSCVNRFKELGELARGLVPLLRKIEEKGGILAGEISYQLQDFNYHNSGPQFDDLIEGRSQFAIVHLHTGVAGYAPEPHQIRDIDIDRPGQSHDELLDFRYGSALGTCRLRIGTDRDGKTAVMFSYDKQSSGVSIQNVIEHLASTARVIFPNLPANTEWYEHWCPSSGVVPKTEIQRVELTYREESESYAKPVWKKIDSPETISERFGFNVSEFDSPHS